MIWVKVGQAWQDKSLTSSVLRQNKFTYQFQVKILQDGRKKSGKLKCDAGWRIDGQIESKLRIPGRGLIIRQKNNMWVYCHMLKKIKVGM